MKPTLFQTSTTRRVDECVSIGRTRAAIVAVLFAFAATGCEKVMRDMYDQPKYKPLAASPLWDDGRSSRHLVPGTVAHSEGTIAGTSSGALGIAAIEPAMPTYPVDASGGARANPNELQQPQPTMPNPLPMTLATLRRGQGRYDIYCAPCHSEAGDGDGMVARRGFPHPPSYHTERLRKAPDAHFYAVITNGYGAMYSYADRVNPQDRWAITAYIRALQLSQHATLEDVPGDERQKLAGAAR